MEDMNIGSLSGLPFFVGKDEKNIISIIKKVKNNNDVVHKDDLYYSILSKFKFYNDDKYKVTQYDEYYKAFCLSFDIELILYSVEVNLHSYLFDEEEKEKIEFLLEKNQLNSKLINSLLSKVILLIHYSEDKSIALLVNILCKVPIPDNSTNPSLYKVSFSSFTLTAIILQASRKSV